MIEVACVQGSPFWFRLRQGLPTGSNFKRIITPAKAEYSKTADNYAGELVAESLGWFSGFHGTPDTQRGNLLEKQAIRWLKFRHGIKTRDVGFCLSDCGRYGASPDAMTLDGEPVEVKAPDLHTFIRWRLDGGLPDEHKSQVHGEMFVTGAQRAYFVAYPEHSLLDAMMIVVERDEFTEKLGQAVLRFCDRLAEIQAELLGDELENVIKSKLEMIENAKAQATTPAPTNDDHGNKQ